MTLTIRTEDLGSMLKVWRVLSGRSLRDAVVAVNGYLPASERISHDTLHRYERNDFPKGGPATHVLRAIAVAFGHSVSEYPEEVQTDLKMEDELSALTIWYGRKGQDAA